ncbi:MAG TPA: rhodanese-like domain-containing protein, partial [Azospira sp.]|nr:rhodanese-like domain-containing protein [Azospira sp.]
QTYAGVLEIDPEWVAEHLGEICVLDVREAGEANERLGGEASGCIAGALCIPLGELAARAGELPGDRPLVAVCHSGTRSAQATAILRAAGFARVANLHGGLLRWRQLGLPTSRG